MNSQAKGAFPCAGGCGRMVSANKKKCLRCLCAEVRGWLESKGLPATDEEIEREMRHRANA